jgi:hypothetical protein
MQCLTHDSIGDIRCVGCLAEGDNVQENHAGPQDAAMSAALSFWQRRTCWVGIVTAWRRTFLLQGNQRPLQRVFPARALRQQLSFSSGDTQLNAVQLVCWLPQPAADPTHCWRCCVAGAQPCLRTAALRLCGSLSHQHHTPFRCSFPAGSSFYHPICAQCTAVSRYQ